MREPGSNRYKDYAKHVNDHSSGEKTEGTAQLVDKRVAKYLSVESKKGLKLKTSPFL